MELTYPSDILQFSTLYLFSILYPNNGEVVDTIKYLMMKNDQVQINNY